MDVTDAHRRLDEQIQQAQRHAEQTQEFARRTEELRVQHTSADGDVAVTVDSLGRLVDLELAPHALGLDGAALSRLILDTARQAHTQAGQQVIAWSQEAFGADSQTAALLAESYLPKETPSEDDEGPKKPPPYLFGR